MFLSKTIPNFKQTDFLYLTEKLTSSALSHETWHIACVAGGMRERASGGGGGAISREEFASAEAASEIPACHV